MFSKCQKYLAFKRTLLSIFAFYKNLANSSYSNIKYLLDLMHDKHIIIIGAAPTAEKIKQVDIPNNNNIILLTTNKAIYNIKDNTNIFIYSTSSFSLQESKETLQDRINAYKVDNIIINKNKILGSNNVLSRFIIYNYDDIYYTVKLLHQKKIINSFFDLTKFILKTLCSNYHIHPSQGVFLIILAYLSKPKAIYTIGITKNKNITYSKYSAYNTKQKYKRNNHLIIDSLILNALKKDITQLDNLEINKIQCIINKLS